LSELRLFRGGFEHLLLGALLLHLFLYRLRSGRWGRRRGLLSALNGFLDRLSGLFRLGLRWRGRCDLVLLLFLLEVDVGDAGGLDLLVRTDELFFAGRTDGRLLTQYKRYGAVQRAGRLRRYVRQLLTAPGAVEGVTGVLRTTCIADDPTGSEVKRIKTP
jgi:hypothetical protein